MYDTVLFLSFAVNLLAVSECHVVLTWPPARYFPFDYLNNRLTPAPCGIPKSVDDGAHMFYTTFTPGQTFNVTWNMALAHRGGFRIELLDATERRLATLSHDATKTNFIGRDDETTETFQVTLPDAECHQCVLRLARQGARRGPYNAFQTCADIDVVRDVKTGCSGNGIIGQGKCQCDRLFHGDACQYQDDCMADSDCSSQGRCIELAKLSYPRMVCYCVSGFVGKFCNSSFFNWRLKPSPVTLHSFKKENYEKKVLTTATDTVLYWRLIQSDGTHNATQLEMVIEYRGSSWMALGWRPPGLSANCKDYPIKLGPGPGWDGIGRSEGLLDVSAANVTKQLVTSGNASSPSELSGMDCRDVIYGSATGVYGRVFDAYTRDRSTPLRDEKYGGTDSLTAADAVEVDGVTRVLFRKPLIADSKSDHTIYDTKMDMAWAAGQHLPPHDKFYSFYQADVFKYHGKKNRLLFVLNFFEGQNQHKEANNPNCEGAFEYPAGCSDCRYKLSWTVDSKSISVTFDLEVTMRPNQWSGVGFSSDGTMTNMDCIIAALASSGAPIIEDRHTTLRSHSEPTVDRQQNIGNVTKDYSDGKLRIQFTRLLSTGDSNDFDLNSCVRLIYPVIPAPVRIIGSETRMSYHQEIPLSSEKSYCFGRCARFLK